MFNGTHIKSQTKQKGNTKEQIKKAAKVFARNLIHSNNHTILMTLNITPPNTLATVLLMVCRVFKGLPTT
jgi:hypothetical protein